MAFSIRRFLPHDWEAYKAIRLEALQHEPGVFGNPYAKEAAYEDSVWQERLRNPRVASFGLYSGNETLVGLTSISSTAEQPDEAYLSQSYIRKEFRGQGLSGLLYDVRLAWARAQVVRLLHIGHRRSNEASKRANQRYGFQFSRSEPRIWPDGGREDMLYYTLRLERA